MGFKLFRINRKVQLDELEDLLEYKFVYDRMINELDDPIVLSMYLLGEEEIKHRSLGMIIETAEQIKCKIDNYCSKYKLNNLGELEFERLTNYSKGINKLLSYGMYCMIHHGRLSSIPNFLKYMPQDKLMYLGHLAMEGIRNSQNLTYMPPEAFKIPEEISNIQDKLDPVWDNLILSWNDDDTYIMFRSNCYSPDELELSLHD